MRKLILSLIIMAMIMLAGGLLADLHCRVIELEQNNEVLRAYVQELQEAVFEGDNVIEITPSGYLKLVDNDIENYKED